MDKMIADALKYLIEYLQGKQYRFESRHPWRQDWEFVILHALQVEAYTLKILERERHTLSEREVGLLQIAAVLHDIARWEITDDHAQLGAQLAGEWLAKHGEYGMTEDEKNRLLEMIAGHSNKERPENDYCIGVLKDADTLDEIGAMSIFMSGNWVDRGSPFFFHHLRQRLVDFEIPFCDEKLSILNTEGAKEILREKKAFVEGFIRQLTEEIEVDKPLEEMLLDASKNI
jgi:uncharacterized protein